MLSGLKVLSTGSAAAAPHATSLFEEPYQNEALKAGDGWR